MRVDWLASRLQARPCEWLYLRLAEVGQPKAILLTQSIGVIEHDGTECSTTKIYNALVFGAGTTIPTLGRFAGSENLYPEV